MAFRGTTENDCRSPFAVLLTVLAVLALGLGSRCRDRTEAVSASSTAAEGVHPQLPSSGLLDALPDVGPTDPPTPASPDAPSRVSTSPLDDPTEVSWRSLCPSAVACGGGEFLDALVGNDQLLYVLGKDALLVFTRERLLRRLERVRWASSDALAPDQIEVDAAADALALLGRVPVVVDGGGLTSMADRRYRRFEEFGLPEPRTGYFLNKSVAYTDNELMVAGDRDVDTGFPGRAVVVLREHGGAEWQLDGRTGPFEAGGFQPSIACGRRACFSFGDVALKAGGWRSTVFERTGGDWTDIGHPDERCTGYFWGLAVLPDDEPVPFGQCLVAIRTGPSSWNSLCLDFEECSGSEQVEATTGGSPLWPGARTAFVKALTATDLGLLARLDVTYDDGTNAFAVWLAPGREGFLTAINTGAASRDVVTVKSWDGDGVILTKSDVLVGTAPTTPPSSGLRIP